MRPKDDSVNIHGLQIEMQPVLKYGQQIYDEYEVEFVITSGRDGIHSAGSLHYYGYAVDIRIWGLSDYQIQAICKKFKNVLGKSYDVIFEGDHIHIEYNAILGSLSCAK